MRLACSFNLLKPVPQLNNCDDERGGNSDKDAGPIGNSHCIGNECGKSAKNHCIDRPYE